MDGDLYALAANSVTSVENHGVLCEVTDGRQFHTSWSVNTEVNANGFASSDHFPLGHRELRWHQVAQIAKPFFDFRTKGCEVYLVRRETDHKHPLGASE